MLTLGLLDNSYVVFLCKGFLSQPFVCRLGFPCTTSAAKKDHNSLENLAIFSIQQCAQCTATDIAQHSPYKSTKTFAKDKCNLFQATFYSKNNNKQQPKQPLLLSCMLSIAFAQQSLG